MDHILLAYLEKSCRVGVLLVEHNRQKTLSSRDIQSSSRALLEGSLARHAVSEGSRAVTKFTSFSLKQNEKKKTKAQKSGLVIPPCRVEAFLRKCLPNYINDVRISASAPVYLAAVIEYLAAEILELSGGVAIDNGRKILTRADIKTAIEKDTELDRSICSLPIGSDEN